MRGPQAGGAHRLLEALVRRGQGEHLMTCAGGRRGQSLREEGQEGVPVAVGADSQQRVVVLGATLLEPRRDRQRGFAENTRAQESEHDEEPPQAPVAVPEGVKRLELVVGHACGDDRVDVSRVVLMQPVDEGSHAGAKRIPGRYGNELGRMDRVRAVRTGAAADHDLGVAQAT